MSGLRFIVAMNNQDFYKKCITDCIYINEYPITLFDNQEINRPISERYNSFISSYLANDNAQADEWIVFCHQDWTLHEVILKKLDGLNVDNIYGTCGVTKDYLFKYIRQLSDIKRLICHPKNLFLKRRLFLGEMKIDESAHKIGINLKKPTTVETLDCCCMIIHSSLIAKYQLSFDPIFDFHLYIEDFCLNAKKKFNIKTQAIQVNCTHYGKGQIDAHFTDLFAKLKQKYGRSDILVTPAV